jgi:predicted nucleic acid-binding protein
MRLVLDADVLIGALDSDDAHHTVARALFTRSQRQDDTRLISVVNLAEVLIAPSADPRRLRTARQAIGALGVVIHQPTEALGVDAARLRGQHPISLPDAFCLATARHAAGAIASFDRKVLRAAEAEQIALVS